MPTYYYGSLYRKEKDKWLLIKKNINMNFVKNFMNGWNIDAIEINYDDSSLNDLVYSTDYFYTIKYIGKIKKENLIGIDTNKFTKNENFNVDSNSLIFLRR